MSDMLTIERVMSIVRAYGGACALNEQQNKLELEKVVRGAIEQYTDERINFVLARSTSPDAKKGK